MKEIANKTLTTTGGELHRIKEKGDVQLQIDYSEIKVTSVFFY